MKRVMIGILWCLVASLGARLPALAVEPNHARSYANIRPQLRTSAVPVLLPGRLPRALGAIRSVAVISAGSTGYYVGFSPLTHCSGALSCAYFHVAGYPRSTLLDHASHSGREVRLPGGAHGFFHPTDCSGAGCTEASLLFLRGAAIYELDAKVPHDALAVLECAYRDLRKVR